MQDPEAAATHWKWPHLDPECSRVALIPGSPIEPCALEDEDGELMGKEEHAFRIKAQKELPRVTWNMEQRSWLSQDTCQRCVVCQQRQHKTSISVCLPLEYDPEACVAKLCFIQSCQNCGSSGYATVGIFVLYLHVYTVCVVFCRVRKNLAQCPLVPMELIRMTAPPSSGKGKAKV